MSDHLLEVLTPLGAAAAWGASDLFDRLEVFIALAMVDAHPEVPSEGCYIAPGRFCWAVNMEQDYPAARVLEEAEQHGADWAPLRDGFLKGGVARSGAVREAL